HSVRVIILTTHLCLVSILCLSLPCFHPSFFSLIPPPPRPTLFPYTTLFRSRARCGGISREKGRASAGPAGDSCELPGQFGRGAAHASDALDSGFPRRDGTRRGAGSGFPCGAPRRARRGERNTGDLDHCRIREASQQTRAGGHAEDSH